jgi:hypothetical protein
MRVVAAHWDLCVTGIDVVSLLFLLTEGVCFERTG